MSKTVLIVGSLLSAAILAAGCWALMLGEDKLFFQCAVSSIFVFWFLYLGNFFQSLNSPTDSDERFRARGLNEEIQALAEANPQNSGLRKMFGWLIVGVLFIVVIHLVST